jgi:hypothetical protein
VRVNALVRGVAVASGTHELTFEYRPSRLLAAASVSLLATLLLVAIGARAIATRTPAL